MDTYVVRSKLTHTFSQSPMLLFCSYSITLIHTGILHVFFSLVVCACVCAGIHACQSTYTYKVTLYLPQFLYAGLYGLLNIHLFTSRFTYVYTYSVNYQLISKKSNPSFLATKTAKFLKFVIGPS